MQEYSEYNAAIDLIRQTLMTIRPALQNAFGAIAAIYKSDRSPVTELDIQVEEALKQSLRQLDPAIGFFGEETEHESIGERSWLIDPIDGTEYFIRGIPLCANVVALYERGVVNIAVIYNFMTDEFFYAIRGRGAFLNGAPIHVAARPLDQSLVIYESSADAVDEFRFLRALCTAIPAGNVFHHFISGYQLAQVACGKYDGVICHKPAEAIWDVAAGALLIQEAGGTVVNLGATTYDVTNLDFIAATPTVFDTLRGRGLV